VCAPLRGRPARELTARALRVLTWNLFHGRSLPASRRELIAHFAAALASWEWDAALLQEVPPWWPSRLAQASGAQQRTALTSRNSASALRRALARRWPELLKSNGGGANAVLARTPILAHRALRLRRWPERRVAQLVRLEDGVCLANYHASSRVELAQAELEALCEHALQWAGGAPLVIGGDLNLRAPRPTEDGLAHICARDVDHIFARGLGARAPCRRLERDVQLGSRRVALSDHVPLIAELRPSEAHASR
jgi:endonuclease/exonuclease/phosphatase family metal-dependent hydrolase